MSILKKKAEHNYIAAEKLINEHLHSSSVHCSYYSCLQLMKHIVQDFCGISYENQDIEIRNTRSASHEYLKVKIESEIARVDISKKRWFKNTFGDLKQFRVEADYHDIEVNSDKSKGAFQIAGEIRTYLKKF